MCFLVIGICQGGSVNCLLSLISLHCLISFLLHHIPDLLNYSKRDAYLVQLYCWECYFKEKRAKKKIMQPCHNPFPETNRSAHTRWQHRIFFPQRDWCILHAVNWVFTTWNAFSRYHAQCRDRLPYLNVVHSNQGQLSTKATIKATFLQSWFSPILVKAILRPPL